MKNASRCSSVSKVTGYGLDDRGSTSSGTGVSLLPPRAQISCVPRSSLIDTGLELPERELDHSLHLVSG